MLVNLAMNGLNFNCVINKLCQCIFYNEKVFNKNRVIRTATKRTQVYDLQHNALTSLVHFAV